jgi:hypothetical protein
VSEAAVGPPPEAGRPALRCSFASQLRGDPAVGTAAPASAILLVEQPGPWGRQALVESRLDPQVAAALSARAVARGMRVLVIRRPGRSADAAGRRRWAVVDCRPGREVTSWGEFGADTDLLGLPLDGSAGTSSYRPTYLVCAHGRHDACCAIKGRPVGAALATLRPDDAWECSHVGGDRFAANVLTLPHGLYYGRVDARTAGDVVAAQERGEVLLSLLRGRTTFAPVAQAAQHRAREVLGVTGINALNPVSVSGLDHRRWLVRLAHQPADLVATVRTDAGGAAALLTCHAVHPAHPPAFVVEDLREAG